MKVTPVSPSILKLDYLESSKIIFGVIGIALGLGILVYFLGKDACWVPIGLIVMILGFIFLAYTERDEAVINKEGDCTISVKSFFGGQSRSFDIRKVKSLVLNRMLYRPGGRSINPGPGTHMRSTRTYKYTLDFVLVDGNKESLQFGDVPLRGISLSGESDQSLSLKAQQVADFLGIPLQRQEEEPPQIGDVMKSMMERMGNSADIPKNKPF